MKKQNKYQYLKVLQGWWENQWCDLGAADMHDATQRRELYDDLKTYRRNDPRPYRIITRRMLATEQFHA